MTKNTKYILFMTLAFLIVAFVAGIATYAASDTSDDSNEIPAYEPQAPTTRRYIPWRFSVHSGPGFHYPPVTNFNPQYVRVRCGNYDGWILISTSRGDLWTYINTGRYIIERPYNLFRYIEQAAHVGIVSPTQDVSVIQQNGNWLQIATWLGPMWIHLNHEPKAAGLERLLDRFGNNLSVYFKNIETGYTFRHNAERVYFSASVPKAMLALYIYQKAEREEVDLDSIMTFMQQDFMGGSGVIRHRYSLGRTFTQRELLRLNVSESDNIATLMLIREHGLSGYREFISDIGGNPNFVRNRVMNSQLTANEAGIFAQAIFDYIESDGIYSREFKNALLDNQFPFIVSDYQVASKTGWTAPIAWHDMAIVYAPSPYILVILSARSGWTDADYREFREISMAFQEFNDQWFVR